MIRIPIDRERQILLDFGVVPRIVSQLKAGLIVAIAGSLLAACGTSGGVGSANELAVSVSQADSSTMSSSNPEALGYSQEGLAALNQGMLDYVETDRVAGLVTLLASDGRVVSFETHGFNNVADQDAMEKDRIFRIYSMTKPIVGVAMMILYDDGAFELDDPIAKFVPEFAGLQVYTAVDEAGQMIVEPPKRAPTMRDLLSHTAGFGYGLIPSNPVEEAFQVSGLGEATDLQGVIDRIDHIPLQFHPGEGWSYSIGVDIQGHVIEVISGQSLGAFLRARLFEPLGMVDTGFFVPEDKLHRLAALYFWNPETNQLEWIGPESEMRLYIGEQEKQPPFESGGAGLVSTASDYARFAQMVLDGGRLGGVQILKPETVDLMLTDQVADDIALKIVTEDDLLGMRFGLGWGLVEDPEAAGTALGKNTAFWGGAAGTWFWVDRERNTIFVGMVQCYGGGCDRALDPEDRSEAFFTKSANLIDAARLPQSDARQ